MLDLFAPCVDFSRSLRGVLNDSLLRGCRVESESGWPFVTMGNESDFLCSFRGRPEVEFSLLEPTEAA